MPTLWHAVQGVLIHIHIGLLRQRLRSAVLPPAMIHHIGIARIVSAAHITSNSLSSGGQFHQSHLCRGATGWLGGGLLCKFGLLPVIKQGFLPAKISKYLLAPCKKTGAKVFGARGVDIGLLKASLLGCNEPITRRHDPMLRKKFLIGIVHYVHRLPGDKSNLLGYQSSELLQAPCRKARG